MRVATTLTSLLLWAAEGRAQSALDGFDPGADQFVWAFAVQADGKILVGGAFTTLGGGGTGTTARNGLGRLNADGTLDNTFNPGANGQVYAFALQTDGKILVAGTFTTLGGGGTGTSTRNRIARLNPDGSLDAGFNPGANNHAYAMALQTDGKILVGGVFTTLGGGGTGTTTRNHIGRLNPDGSLDTSFNPGTNNTVNVLTAQADGKILVGGFFTTLGGGGTGTTTRTHIGRLNPAGSLDTSFDPGANDNVTALVMQADGKILVGGQFTTLGGGGTGTTTRNNIGRLNSNGTLDTSFDPGANSYVSSLAVQADGTILVGGNFTALGGGGTGIFARNRIGQLNPNGTQTSFNPGASDVVRALAVQADGKILAGGFFHGANSIGGQTRNRIARLYPSGTLDTSLNPGANGAIDALAVQADGKVLVGGNFTTVGGGGSGTTTRNSIGRLGLDGTLDTSFNPGANGSVYALAVQADGRILASGEFTTLGGGGTGTTTRNYIGRLNSNGSLDSFFNPGTNNYVVTLAVQADGKILVGGNFTTLGGGGTGTTTRNHIGRLNADGTLDNSFNPGANNSVYVLAVQRDSKILVGGLFTTLGGGGIGTTTRNYIGRLNADGTLDTSFNPGANSTVYALALQADGKIIVSGDFTALGGGGTGTTARNKIGRLNPDGTPDNSFDPGANDRVQALAVQADGKILVAGNFSILGGGGIGNTARNKIGRLTNPAAAFESLAADTNGTIINWLRSAAAPEVDRVTFELSADGINYTALANPIRISGGWQLTGQNLPIHQNIFIRARGFYSTGIFDGAGSIVETVRNAFISPPPIPTQIVSQKSHGAGSFGINLPLTGNPGIECRTGGASGNHQVIVTFALPITITFAAVTSGTGSVASAGAVGNQVIVNLTGVTNAQKIAITLLGLNDGTNTGNLDIPMGVLLGDATGNGAVNASDVSQTKSKSGQAVDASNFRTDVTVSNSINSSDVSAVKSKSGTALP